MNLEKYNDLFGDKKVFERYSYLILAAFSVESIIRYIEIFLGKLPFISSFADLFTPALFILLIYINYNAIISKRVWVKDIVFLLIFFFVVIISYLVFPDTRSYVEAQIDTIVFTFPLYYLLGIIFVMDKKVLDILALLAKVIILVDILFVVYYTGAGNELGEDSMARAYRMLPSVLFLITQAFNRHKLLDWIWVVFSTIYILTCGTRGPMIVIFVYLAYCLLIKATSSKRKKVIYICFMAAFIVFYFSDSFIACIEWLSKTFSSLGLSSRIFDFMLENTLVSDTSGRDVIYEYIFDLLKENPFGYGILGEYPFLGWNTHNFYLQILMHFGIIFGAIIIIAILVIISKAYSKNPNPYAKDFVIMWACVTLIRGFAGGSYLSYYFAFLLGFCIREIRNKRDLYKK